MTRWCGVISEAEHQQFRCSHQLEKLDAKNPHNQGFKYRCLKCGKHMMRLNGVIVKTLNQTADTRADR